MTLDLARALDMTPKHNQQKRKQLNWTYNLKYLCINQNYQEKTIYRKNIYVYLRANQDLVSRIYEELKTNNKKNKQ